jgi:hypothetical protein
MRLLRGLLALTINLLAFVFLLAILPVIAGLAVLAFIVMGVVWACSGGTNGPKGGPEHHE